MQNLTSEIQLKGPVWLMQPIPYFGEKLSLKEWLYEPKIDGWRLQIIKYDKKTIELWGRRLEKTPNWTEKLHYLIGIIDNFLPAGSLVDCELYSEKGRRWIPSLFSENLKVKPIIYIFDIIFYEKEFVGDLQLIERRKLLEKFNLKPPFLIPQLKQIKDLTIALNDALQQDAEGIVIKNIYSKYQISQTGPIATQWWRKIKR